MTKDDFRQKCLERLRYKSRFTKIKKNIKISLNIKKLIKLHKPKKILLYLPLKNEVDLRKLILELNKDKKYQVYVPFMYGDSFIPVPYRLPLYKKKFGIYEPNFSSMQLKRIDIDMMVVPIVGVDKTYRRVGFGAGMYDRFYEKLQKKPIVVFTQLTLCKTNSVITQKHDIGPDYIIT